MWRLKYTSDIPGATFYIWRGGVLIATTQVPFYDIQASGSELIFVFDSAEDLPDTDDYPNCDTLWWEHVDGAKAYEVEEYVDAAWTLRARIRDMGQWVFKWTSGVLTDCESHQFRLRTIGVDTAGQYKYVTPMMVRYPDHTEWTASIDSDTGVLSFA